MFLSVLVNDFNDLRGKKMEQFLENELPKLKRVVDSMSKHVEKNQTKSQLPHHDSSECSIGHEKQDSLRRRSR